MARKLKTYRTAIGFFDLAIAAPSMKAALDAWGSKSNLFHQGFAKETTDTAAVAATMARPGVVLRRPVGSNGAFAEHAVLPTSLATGTTKKQPSENPKPKIQEPPRPKFNDKTVHEAVVASKKEQIRVETKRREAEAARAREAKRRERAIVNVEAAFDEAKQVHEKRIEDIKNERAELDRRTQAEVARWEKQKEQLEAKLRQARE
jgi:colicin import membrane protein